MDYPRLNGGHVPAVREIARVSFPRLWEPKEFAYFLDHDCGLCLADVKDGKLRGYFLGLLVAGDLDVVSVATDPHFRRQGVGEGLMRAALSRPSVGRARVSGSGMPQHRRHRTLQEARLHGDLHPEGLLRRSSRRLQHEMDPLVGTQRPSLE
jgi:GNAT superfamily N-acetyltransferase